MTKKREPQSIRRARLEKHLQMPWAEWQTKKRQEWKNVNRALQLFEFGAAFTPAGEDLYEMRKAAARIAEAMAEDWVSW